MDLIIWLSIRFPITLLPFPNFLYSSVDCKPVFTMADNSVVIPVVSGRPPGEEEQGGEGGGSGLTDAQMELLDRCLHALKHAQNDSHTLAALLLVSVSCWHFKYWSVKLMNLKTDRCVLFSSDNSFVPSKPAGQTHLEAHLRGCGSEPSGSTFGDRGQRARQFKPPPA